MYSATLKYKINWSRRTVIGKETKQAGSFASFLGVAHCFSELPVELWDGCGEASRFVFLPGSQTRSVFRALPKPGKRGS